MSLLNMRCPTNIAWFVVSIAVYAIYGMLLGRWISDVCVKGQEVFAPFFTDGNASTPVICVTDRVGIIASPLHSGPSSVDLRICRVLSMNIMRSLTSRHCLFKPAISSNICVETSTRFRMPPLQIFSNNPAITPALTRTKPVTNCSSGLFPSRLELFGDGQPPKSFAT